MWFIFPPSCENWKDRQTNKQNLSGWLSIIIRWQWLLWDMSLFLAQWSGTKPCYDCAMGRFNRPSIVTWLIKWFLLFTLLEHVRDFPDKNGWGFKTWCSVNTKCISFATQEPRVFIFGNPLDALFIMLQISHLHIYLYHKTQFHLFFRNPWTLCWFHLFYFIVQINNFSS